MCIHVSLGGQALLSNVFAQTLSTDTHHVARGIYKAKDLGAYNSFGGGVRVNCT